MVLFLNSVTRSHWCHVELKLKHWRCDKMKLRYAILLCDYNIIVLHTPYLMVWHNAHAYILQVSYFVSLVNDVCCFDLKSSCSYNSNWSFPSVFKKLTHFFLFLSIDVRNNFHFLSAFYIIYHTWKVIWFWRERVNTTIDYSIIQLLITKRLFCTYFNR